MKPWASDLETASLQMAPRSLQLVSSLLYTTINGLIFELDAVMSPALNFNVPASNGTHIVMMVDLDAGNATHPHAYSPLLHWSKAIPSGSSSLSGNGSTMSDFAFYFGPAPPPGSGPHRYVVLLFSNSNNTFEIPPSFKDFNSSNISERFGFDVETFMTEGKLEVQAANWFTSENTTVPVATNGAGRSVSLEMTSATLFSAFIFGLLLI